MRLHLHNAESSPTFQRRGDSLPHLRAIGSGRAVPGLDAPGAVVDNVLLSELHARAAARSVALGASPPPACDPEFPRERIGIEARCVADVGVTAESLAVDAARRAILDAAHRRGVAPSDLARRIRVILVASVTAHDPAPAAATRIAGAIGAPEAVFAMDVALGCNGFVAAIGAAGALLGDDGGLALVVGSETMTRVLDATDRNTLPIFGDGAGALVVEGAATPRRGLTSSSLATLPEGGPSIRITRRKGSCAPLLRIGSNGARVELRTESDTPFVVRMEGRRVFRDMVRTLPRLVADWLRSHGLQASDFDAFAFHQANARLLEGVFDALELPRERCLMNIETFANTTSASIPLLLDHAWRMGRLRAGARVLLVGFGTGYSAGVSSLTWIGERR